MCWESSFPPAVGIPACRAQAHWARVRGRGGPSVGQGPPLASSIPVQHRGDAGSALSWPKRGTQGIPLTRRLWGATT